MISFKTSNSGKNSVTVGIRREEGGEEEEEEETKGMRATRKRKGP